MAKRPNTQRPAPDEQPVDELTFEQAVEELEGLVERIESGEIGLEASIAAYERGVKLRERCRSILDETEQRIETLERETADKRPGAGPGSSGVPDNAD